MPSPISPRAVASFKENSVPARLGVFEVQGLGEALDLAVALTEKKEKAANLLAPKGPSGGGAGDAGDFPDPSGGRKTLFVDGVPPELWEECSRKAEARGVRVGRGGARLFYGGVDTAFSVASLGIAGTATCVVESLGEDGRVPQELCETHVVALKKSLIVETLRDAEDFLREALRREGNFLSFITGPSRTSDIERVLALGAHGPLELFVALLEE